MTSEKNIAEVGLDFPWSDIIRLPFRVVDYENNGTQIKEDGTVVAKNLRDPYAHLLVEHPGLDFNITLPVIHKDDYRLIASVYDHPDVMLHKKLEDRELLVVYAPEHTEEDGRASGWWHVLHFALAPGGTLESYIRENDEEVLANVNQLVGEFSYQGELQVHFKNNNERFEQLILLFKQ